MISWSGVSFCLGGAALYGLSYSVGRDAEYLRSVKRVNQLGELASLLDKACKVIPFVVCAAGRVGSETPINCEHSSLRAVILEETAEQHFLKHNDSGSWIQDSVLMLSMHKEVPWYLDDGTGRVYVIGARGATGLELSVASEIFEESGRSLFRGTLDYLQGLKMLGVKRVERVLPTGAPLTVVGEAVKDDVGNVRIQRPQKGPFYISPKSIDQLISNLGKWSSWYKFASFGFTFFGVYLVVSHTIRRFMERRRRHALQRRVLEAAAKHSDRKAEGELIEGEQPNDRKTDGRVPDLCVICLERQYNAVFAPCGHMCCCTSCSSHLKDCPLCRRRIEQMIRTYRH